MNRRKSWTEKLKAGCEPQVVQVPESMRQRLGGAATLVIPRPLDVDALVRQVPKGRLVTQKRLREALAAASNADAACPITTGIFVRIVAEAAAEKEAGGAKRVTPYWRVVRDDGSFVEKFPGGPEKQAERLRAEGHRIVERRGKLRVELPDGVMADVGLPPEA